MKKANFDLTLTRRKRHKGLSIIEVVVAIAIIGILSASLVHSMVSSSKTYYKSSTEAQLQSEAQLVANSITDIAVDSYNATDQMSDAMKADFGVTDTTYDTATGKLLVLYSKSVDASGGVIDSQYAVIRKTGTDELYLIERTNSGSGWSRNEAVLANYISDFSVSDIARVQTENMLSFELAYSRQDSNKGTMRTYKGNYQVLMRNKQYAGVGSVSSNTANDVKLVLNVTPKVVYLDVKGSTDSSKKGKDFITSYHAGNVSVGTDTDGVSTGVEIRGSVLPVAYNDDITWRISNVDDGYFFFKDPDDAENPYKKSAVLDAQPKLYWKSEKDMSQLTVDSFEVVMSKDIVVSGTDESGNPVDKTVKANPKKVSFKIRRIRSLGLRPTAGATQWKPIYTTELGGTQSEEASYYAEATSAGVKDVTIQSSAVAPFVENGGTVTWKLYMKKENSTADWKEVTTESDKKLYAELIPVSNLGNGGIATLSFGSAAYNGQLYKIVTQSEWDPTRTAEIVIGVAPVGGGDNSGFFSRGYYIDLLSWVQTNEKYDAITMLKDASLGAAGGTSEKSGYKLTQRDGRYYLLYDYNAAYYSGEDRINLYNKVQTLEIAIKNQTGNAGNDGLGIEGSTVSNLMYITMPVYTHRIPNVAVDTATPIILKKGTTMPLRVQTEYYNIHDRSMLGVYIGDKGDSSALEVNLNKSGLNNSNTYLSFGIDESQYGGLYSFKDSIKVDLSAKANIKAYNPNPMTVRLTADDFYVLARYGVNSNKANGDYTYPTNDTGEIKSVDVDGGNGVKNLEPRVSSYAEYMVYIANVEGQNVFVPCPDTSTKATDPEMDWSTKFESSVNGADSRSKAVNVTCYKADGTRVTDIAKAYKSGGKYKLVYNGTEYTYNRTYKYWQK